MGDDVRTQYDLDDTGSRYQLYSELIEIWETGIEILERKRIMSEHDKVRILQLRGAMEMLRLTMSGMGGYKEHIETIKYQINMIPNSSQLKADEMPGDRGSPLLKKWDGSTWVDDLG